MNVGSGYLLLVEDDPDILKLLDTTLTFSGYRVIKARNGNEGLECIQRERPAIVIADIMMPELDGFGLVHRMRLNPETRDIPVVFITATYVSPEDKEFAFNVGATQFIQKPINLEEFLETIAELLKQGMPVVIEPLDEFNFYDGYRIRLETKLAQINKKITRDEFLLGTKSDAGDQDLQISLNKEAGIDLL
jgi:DNA-binding response OmpR family regulator